MEQVLQKVYRFSGPYTKKKTAHSYLLLRDEGNLFVACHHGPRSEEELAEVEALGGIGSQWVCHQHDVKRRRAPRRALRPLRLYASSPPKRCEGSPEEDSLPDGSVL